jgi:hypothetical protein
VVVFMKHKNCSFIRLIDLCERFLCVTLRLFKGKKWSTFQNCFMHKAERERKVISSRPKPERGRRVDISFCFGICVDIKVYFSLKAQIVFLFVAGAVNGVDLRLTTAVGAFSSLYIFSIKNSTSKQFCFPHLRESFDTFKVQEKGRREKDLKVFRIFQVFSYLTFNSSKGFSAFALKFKLFGIKQSQITKNPFKSSQP